jgi:hypothetical protein
MSRPALLIGLCVFLGLLGYREWRERKSPKAAREKAHREARARTAALQNRPAPSRSVFGLSLGETRPAEARTQLTALGLRECQEALGGHPAPRLGINCPAPPERLGRSSSAGSGHLTLVFAGPGPADRLVEVMLERTTTTSATPAVADFNDTVARLSAIYRPPLISSGGGPVPSRESGWRREWRFRDLEVELSVQSQDRAGGAWLVRERYRARAGEGPDGGTGGRSADGTSGG